MYKNILIPVVFGDGHDTQASFMAAKALADAGANFTILHVMETMPGHLAGQIPESALENTHKEITKGLKEMAGGLPNSKPVLITGHAGRTITDYAEQNDVDCIVMASHRPGLVNYLLGSTADRVVRHAACSVHVIR